MYVFTNYNNYRNAIWYWSSTGQLYQCVWHVKNLSLTCFIFITYHRFTSCHNMYQNTDISCQYYELGISLWYLTRICTYVHMHHGFLFTALYFGIKILRSLKCLPENLTYRFCMLWAIKSDLLFLNWKPWSIVMNSTINSQCNLYCISNSSHVRLQLFQLKIFCEGFLSY